MLDEKIPTKSSGFFVTFAKTIAHWSGSSTIFFCAMAVVVIWGLTGPLFGYSDTWQLVINTSTTIITFLMVFLIQNTQNRDTKAMQLKLDELIRTTQGAHLVLLDLEELDEEELSKISEKYIKLASEAREKLRRHEKDTDNPEIDL